MGDNIYLGDRNGVRTPMQWNANRNAGFSNAGPQQLYLPVVVDYEYHYETLNVETQQNNPNSLLAWMKRLIALRQQSPALEHGAIELLQPNNPESPGLRPARGRRARAGRGKPLPLPAVRGTRPGVAGRTCSRRAIRTGRVSTDRVGPLFADAWVARLLLVRPAAAGNPARGGRRRACPGNRHGGGLARAGSPRQLGRGFHGHCQPGAGKAPAGVSAPPSLVRRQGQNDPDRQHLGRDSAAVRGDARASRPGPAAGRVQRRGARRLPGSDGLWRSKNNCDRRNRRAPRR